MKVKKVNRYYCEYCKKSGCSARWMKRHEERCTMNPNRKCGYCGLLDQEQVDISCLMILLPNPKEYEENLEFGGKGYVGLGRVVNEALPKLREVCGSCPACVMAALRQKGIPVPIANDFDFKAEGQAIWDEFNAERIEKEEESFAY